MKKTLFLSVLMALTQPLMAAYPDTIVDPAVRDAIDYLDTKIDSALNTVINSSATLGIPSGILPVIGGGTGSGTATGARANLGVPSVTGTGAAGTWPINITGAAASATLATKLASAPSVCPAPQAFNGIDIYGNALGCFTPGGSGAGDNLGNHIADTFLTMSNFDILGVKGIYGSSGTFNATDYSANVTVSGGLGVDTQKTIVSPASLVFNCTGTGCVPYTFNSDDAFRFYTAGNLALTINTSGGMVSPSSITASSFYDADYIHLGDFQTQMLQLGQGIQANAITINGVSSSLTAETSIRIIQDNLIKASTGAISAALTSETNRATARENDIAVSTGAINSDLQAYKTTVQSSTASIYQALQSTASALTAETSRAIARENAIAVSTGALEASKVNRSGDTMTGQLTISGSSLTVTSPLGVSVPRVTLANNVVISSATSAQMSGVYVSSNLYVNGNTNIVGGLVGQSWANFASSVTAGGSFYGDGSHLTGLTGYYFARKDFYSLTNGVSTQFYLDYVPLDNSVILTRNGATLNTKEDVGVDYIVNGTTITMSVAPPSSTTLVAYYATNTAPPTPATVLPYIIYNGQRLYVTPSNSTSTFRTDFEWGYKTGTGGAIGTTSTTDGSSNTAVMAALAPSGFASTPAAGKLCADYVFGGYSDWYLPAKDQLLAIYQNKDNIITVGYTFVPFSTDRSYWSSTEFDTYYAWKVDFITGEATSEFPKNNAYEYARCVRSDTPVVPQGKTLITDLEVSTNSVMTLASTQIITGAKTFTNASNVYYGSAANLTNIVDAAVRVSTGALYVALGSTAAALTSETARAIARENYIAASTGIINSALLAEVSRATARENAIGASTGTIQTQLNNVAASTGTISTSLASVILSTGVINASLVSEVSRATTRENAIGASTGTIQTQLNNVAASTGAISTSLASVILSTGVIASNLATETSNRMAADNAIGVATGTLRSDLTTETNARIAGDNAIGVATGTLRTDLTTETNNRIAGDTAIGITTGTLRSDLTAETNARISGDNAIGVTTGTIYAALNSTAAALTAEIARATLRENQIGASTGTIKASLDAVILSTAPLKDYANWNTAYGWGNHAVAGYANATAVASATGTLTTNLANEVTNRTNADLAIGLTTGTLRTDLTSETTNRVNGDLAIGVATGTLRADLDAVILTTGPLANYANWDTAYSWGDHSLVGYLTAETDPVFIGHEAFNITPTSTTQWNTAYGWGDHSVAGYADRAAVALATGTLTTDLANEVLARGNSDLAIGLTTGTLRTDVDAKLPLAGGTMTGQLTNTSSVTITGNGGIYGLVVSSNVYMANGLIQTTNGKIGLGGAYDPSYGLKVTGTSFFSGAAAFNGIVTATRINDYSNGNYYLDPANATRSMVLAGQVGIGTTAPAYKLDVTGGVHATSSMTVDGGYFGDGSGLTGVVKSTITYLADEVTLTSNGTTFSALSSSVTLQGNTFNGNDQLVKLESDGKLPAIDGSQLTGIQAGVTSIVAGTNITIDPSGGTGAVTINASGGGGVSVATFTMTLGMGGDVFLANSNLMSNAGAFQSVSYSTINITGIQCFVVSHSTTATTSFNIAWSTDTVTVSSIPTYGYLNSTSISIASGTHYSDWVVPDTKTLIDTLPALLYLHTTAVPATGTLPSDYGCNVRYWRRLDQ